MLKKKSLLRNLDPLIFLIYIHTAVIHFENGHHGSSGLLLIRTLSPKLKTMSSNFISQRNIKFAILVSISLHKSPYVSKRTLIYARKKNTHHKVQ